MIYLIYDRTRVFPPTFEFKNDGSGIYPMVTYDSESKVLSCHERTITDCFNNPRKGTYDSISDAYHTIQLGNNDFEEQRYTYINLSENYPEVLI